MDNSSLVQLKYNSEYPSDMVVYILDSSVTMTGGPSVTTASENIEEGLYFLPMGYWSLTSNFATKIPFSVYPGALATNDPGFAVASFPGELRFYAYNTSGSATYYYRLYGLLPTGSTFNYNFTNSVRSDFIANSDILQPIPYIETIATRPGGGSGIITTDISLSTTQPRLQSWGVDNNLHYLIPYAIDGGVSGFDSTSHAYLNSSKSQINTTFIATDTVQQIITRAYIYE